MMRILQRKALQARAIAGQKNQVTPMRAREAVTVPAGLHYGGGIVRRASDTGGQALPGRLRSGIESLSGMDMSGVRVHYASPRPAQLNALAYAQGSHIHLARGEERHLPHEAWHVVQQRQKRVAPTRELGGIQVNDEASLEREADAMGHKASEMVAGSPPGVGLQEAPTQSDVVQRVPIEAKVSWNITHVVEENNGSLFNGEEIGALGELEFGEKLVVDNEDVFVSRRGGNQENSGRRNDDRQAEPGRNWYRVLILKGQDVRSLSLYVREETIARSDSTDYLDQLVSTSNMGGWNAGNPDLANAHHKFPKSAIGWLYDHMTAQQRADLRLAVFLPGNAGPTALARLRSILITPRAQQELVSSDERSDDPHNNRGGSAPSEAFLDLVHQSDGGLTPRSRVVQSLANDVVKQIYLKYRLMQLAGEGEAFVISDDDAQRVIDHFRRSEELHYAIENNPRLPSHSSGDAFERVDHAQSKKYVKKPVAPIGTPEGNLSDRYEQRQALLREKDKTRKEIIRRFFDWLGKGSKNEQEDMIKCDFVGRKGWIVRYIYGARRGTALSPQTVDPFWMQKLLDYAAGNIPEDQLDEKMPWLQSLFMHD
jgi:hypothetical protein